jgi:transketolase
VDEDHLDEVLEELELETGVPSDGVAGEPSRPRVPAAGPAAGPPVRPGPIPSLPAMLTDRDHVEAFARGSFATRTAYGLALAALGRARPDVVALDGDVSDSTRARFFAADEALSGRFFECRIAEQSMVSCAAGLAAGGKTPFVSTFGKFLTRAYDQIEMALLGGLPLRLVGSHAGVSLAADGPSQMALPGRASRSTSGY